MSNYKEISYIFINIQVVLGIIGIIGNILAICVFNRKALKKYSYSFYWRVRVMAVSDIVILIEAFDNWANFVLDARINHRSEFLCTISEFFSYVASYLSIWLLAVISFDRLLTIAYPLRLNTIRQRWFQVVVVSLLLLYCVLISLRPPLNYQLKHELVGNNNVTQSTCHLPTHIEEWVSYCFAINVFVVNIVINNLTDLKLVYLIRASKKRSHCRTSSVHSISSLATAAKDRKFAISSIALNVVSCLVKMPFAIGMYASNYFNLESEQREMVFIITVTILIIDNCDLLFTNLFVNSIFYNEFLKMIKIR